MRVSYSIGLLSGEVGDMNERLALQYSPADPAWYTLGVGCRPSHQRIMCGEFRKGSRDTTLGDGLKLRPVECPERAKGDVAQAHRLFKHRVEDRREVTGGGIDDPQHLG